MIVEVDDDVAVEPVIASEVTGIDVTTELPSSLLQLATNTIAAITDDQGEALREFDTATPFKSCSPTLDLDEPHPKCQRSARAPSRRRSLALRAITKDPLPRTWKGLLWFPKIDTGIYIQGEVEVGGPNQIETPPCKK